MLWYGGFSHKAKYQDFFWASSYNSSKNIFSIYFMSYFNLLVFDRNNKAIASIIGFYEIPYSVNKLN